MEGSTVPDGNAVLPPGRVSDLRRWAEAHIVVGDGPRAGEPFKIGGPAWAEPLDAMDDREVAQVTIRGSVQGGKSVGLIVASLFHMAQGRSVLFFEPDAKLQRAMSARIVAWGRLCGDEAVREAYTPKRPPHVRSTAAGGRLECLSAREAGAGVMRTASVVVVDELRLFHADLLGDLIDRTASFGEAGKLITASSAGFEHECRTSTELDKSDSRRWFLRCPACDRETIAVWKNVSYKGRRWPVYISACCGAEMDSIAFRRAVAAGRWKPTKEPMVEGIRGFHIDAFLSPFESLRTIVRQWRRASAHQKQTSSMAEIISFQTGRLCQPYRPIDAGGVTPESLRTSCREEFDPNVVPAEACVVIAAVDVQDSRLEAEISAWGITEVGEADASMVRGWGSPEFKGLMHAGKWYRLRRWALEYKRLYGDPGDPALWGDLAAFLETPRPHATGPLLRPALSVIDSGGHYTEQTAEFVRTQGGGYMCLKGLPPQRFGAVLARRSVTADSLETYGPSGLLLVCSNSAKATSFSLMRQSIGGVEPKPFVWPLDEGRYGIEEFEGIVSETLMRTIDKKTGGTRLMWRKIMPRNEPLDLLCYSLAAVNHLGVGVLLNEAHTIAAAAGKEAA